MPDMRPSNPPSRYVVAIDVVFFAIIDNDLRVLLRLRDAEPYSGLWATPGGVLKEAESLDEAAERILLRWTGIEKTYLEQLYSFGKPNRDPRGRTVSVTYFGLVPAHHHAQVEELLKNKQAKWFSVYKLPEMAFDHREIIEYALLRLRRKLEQTNAIFSLLEHEFTLTDMQTVYEIVFNREFDKRNFRKKILARDLLEPTGKTVIRGAHRPAQTYRFLKSKHHLVDID